jgi:hypothetical protein
VTAPRDPARVPAFMGGAFGHCAIEPMMIKETAMASKPKVQPPHPSNGQRLPDPPQGAGMPAQAPRAVIPKAAPRLKGKGRLAVTNGSE